jgi:hypothetical protein
MVPVLRIRDSADPDLIFYFDADPDLDKTAKYSSDFMTNSFFSFCTVLWIRIGVNGFNADLDLFTSLRIRIPVSLCRQ